MFCLAKIFLAFNANPILGQSLYGLFLQSVLDLVWITLFTKWSWADLDHKKVIFQCFDFGFWFSIFAKKFVYYFFVLLGCGYQCKSNHHIGSAKFCLWKMFVANQGIAVANSNANSISHTFPKEFQRFSRRAWKQQLQLQFRKILLQLQEVDLDVLEILRSSSRTRQAK